MPAVDSLVSKAADAHGTHSAQMSQSAGLSISGGRGIGLEIRVQ